MLKERVALTAFVAVCDSARFVEWRPRRAPRSGAVNEYNIPMQHRYAAYDGRYHFNPRALSHTATNAVSATRPLTFKIFQTRLR